MRPVEGGRIRRWIPSGLEVAAQQATSPDPERSVTLRYWAAARDAAGCAEEYRPPGPVSQVLEAAAQDHPALARVLAVSAILLDGVVTRTDRSAPAGATLEVLPPFTGG